MPTNVCRFVMFIDFFFVIAILLFHILTMKKESISPVRPIRTINIQLVIPLEQSASS